MDDQGLRRLKRKLQRALKGRPPLELPHRGGLRRAGVLVPLCLKDGRCHILFIKRAEGLPQHAGEMSFPGGGSDPQDGSIVETALREA
ncbi:MAG: CoA pyrophosphatase, partial [Deltaproteobacteria bacterium]